MTRTSRARPPFDVLVIGSGVAGCSAALRLSARHRGRIALLTKGTLGESTTRWAQGGIAAAVSETEDSIELHLADTLRAGAGLCDEDAARILVGEGPERVLELVAYGAVLDRDAEGVLERAREGGHSVARVVHAGGTATGAEVARALAAAVRASDVELLEGYFAIDLLHGPAGCAGVVALVPDGSREEVIARAVILATGGSGQLFDITTNPPESTGDGIAMALRAGAAIADTEFVQFHPTALAVRGHPRPLLSEALRGHGALLLDGKGERFIDELAPRDVVSRAIAETMAREATDHVYLDVRALDGFAERFPSLDAVLVAAGLDPARDLLPVAPAVHYLCGGVLTDLDGATSLPGLWAVGEAACTGVQGANRLASNSLLEGLVFGSRAADALADGGSGARASGAIGPLIDPSLAHGVPVRVLEDLTVSPVLPTELEDPSRALVELQRAMSADAGVLRSKTSLAGAADVLVRARRAGLSGSSIAHLELVNLTEVGATILASATAREESRGAHARIDYPNLDDEHFFCRLVHRQQVTNLGSEPS